MLSSSQNKSSIKTLCVDGAVCDDKQVIVNNLNEYFCTIGPTLSRDIPRSNKMFCDFLPESNQESIFLLPTNGRGVIYYYQLLEEQEKALAMIRYQMN